MLVSAKVSDVVGRKPVLLGAIFAARGLAYEGTTYFTLSKPGTVTVDPKTGY